VERTGGSRRRRRVLSLAFQGFFFCRRAADAAEKAPIFISSRVQFPHSLYMLRVWLSFTPSYSALDDEASFKIFPGQELHRRRIDIQGLTLLPWI
jgi:hypothetical protein